MKTLVVLGAAGFSGRAFTRFFIAQGLAQHTRLRGVDRDVSRALPGEGIDYVCTDVGEPAGLREVLAESRPDLLLNLVGTFKAKAWADSYRLNVGVAETILSECAAGRIAPERALFIGSAAEYGVPEQNPVSETATPKPVNVYGLTKLWQTELVSFYARVHGVPALVARPFNLSGPEAPVELAAGRFRALVKDTANGGELRVGNLESRRDFLDVDSASEYYWNLLSSGVPGEVYNVCSGRSTRMRDLLEELISASGKTFRVVSALEHLRAMDVPEIVGDASKLQRLLTDAGAPIPGAPLNHA